MVIFTQRFIKDILLIILFGVALYGLTHNSIVRPKPNIIKGVWSIELMQHPLVFGIAGHNYLVLRNENSDIVKELHGLATDATTQQWKYIGSDKTDELKVWEFNGPRNYVAQKNYPGIVLEQGDKERELARWNRANTCKKEINDKNFLYPPYGVNIQGDTENSNSVAYTLTLCMGLDAKHLGLITPGWGNSLLKNITAE